MGNRRWGFDEAENWEHEEPGGQPAPAAEPEETLVGQDADQVVRVVVSPEADVVAVRLSPQWRQVVDPRALRMSVLAAANAATVSALARSVEQVDLTTNAAPSENAGADESACRHPPSPPGRGSTWLTSKPRSPRCGPTRTSGTVRQGTWTRRGSLRLTGHDVSMYGMDKGIDTTYAGAQSALEDMLRQAVQNFHDLAGALRHAADMYDESEPTTSSAFDAPPAADEGLGDPA